MAKRWIKYEKEIQDRISQEGDLTLSYTFVEFLLNTLASYDKILVIHSRNRTTKIPIKDIVDCGIMYDTFWCKLDSTADYAVDYAEFKYPEFGIRMTEKRYELNEGTNGPMIYDNTGSDDYYFLNDPKEMEKFINLINSIETEWKKDYNHVMGEYKKQLIQINKKDLQISELKKENHKLQQALLWYFDITVFEYSSTYDKEMEHGCKILFGCSHDEAEEKYGGFEKTETYRELQKEY